MTKRIAADIEFEIMQAVKQGSESGDTVNAWYIARSVNISYSDFKKHANFLSDKGYLARDNNVYRLTEKADKVIRYFKRKEVSELKLSTPESFLKALSSSEDFRPVSIIKRQEVWERRAGRTQEQLMFDFINQVNKSGERGSIPSHINMVLGVSPSTIIKCGEEAERNGYVFSTREVMGGNTYRRFYTTAEGDAWLTETPEKRALGRTIR